MDRVSRHSGHRPNSLVSPYDRAAFQPLSNSEVDLRASLREVPKVDLVEQHGDIRALRGSQVALEIDVDVPAG